ncbi:MAG: hypothetical protein GKR98_11240 [Boseongicola sp.]|nr:MAG: hypothetical protein GKR98_11240 [Boseongicola sp.]
MQDVIHMNPVELIFLDAAHLAELARDRGIVRAEHIANTAIEEIADRMTAVEAAWAAGEFARLLRVGQASLNAAWDIGHLRL